MRKLVANASRVLAAGPLLAFSMDVVAAICAIGDHVQLKEGSDGTLAEIGTESPHVGWYRITFSWSPKGEWYNPATWETRKVDTGEVCVVDAPARGPSAAPAVPIAAASAPRPAVASTAESADCPFVEPPGRVERGARASVSLFQRVIYERAAARVNPESISAPRRVGLSFLEFELGEPYENTLTSTRFGDKRLHTGAPAGAIIYPLKSVELRCDLHGSEVRRTVSEVSHDCFVNKDGDWTCPGMTTKTRESRLIPVG